MDRGRDGSNEKKFWAIVSPGEDRPENAALLDNLSEATRADGGANLCSLGQPPSAVPDVYQAP